MGRGLGSPNTELRWEFVIKHPLQEGVVLFSKQYTSINAMHEDLQLHFTKTQLRSYASKNRNCNSLFQLIRLPPPYAEELPDDPNIKNEPPLLNVPKKKVRQSS
jgi:hypothetical protein